MIHLDTSFLIRSLQGGSEEDRRLRDWLSAGQTLAICTIAWAEFLCGPVDAAAQSAAERMLPQRAPFLDSHAPIAARLYNASGRRRGSLIDAMIAAVAIESDAQIATAKRRDFERFAAAGLAIA